MQFTNHFNLTVIASYRTKHLPSARMA